MKDTRTHSHNEKPTGKPHSKKASSVKDFTNEDDMKQTDSMTRDNSHIIKIANGEKAPLFLLKSQYADGYAHWVSVPSGDKVRVPCLGGSDGAGRAPDQCPICKYVSELYRQAQNSKGGKAEALKRQASDMRANFEIYFVAAKGQLTVVKIDGNKRKTAVDFDDCQVGLLRLSKAQYQTLRGLTSKYDFMTSTKDLFTRYIIADKQVRDKDDYATVEFIPATKPTKRPDVEIPEEVDLDGLFDLDEELATKTLRLHLSNDGDDDDEGIDYENDNEEDDVAPKHKSGGSSGGKARSRNAEADDEVDTDDYDDASDGDDDAEEYDDDGTEADDSEEGDDADDSDDSDDETEVDDSDSESSDFDDDFLDDVDAEYDEEEGTDDEEAEAEPALPRRGKKPAEAPTRGKAKREEPSRGRTSKKPAEAPQKRRSAPEKKPEPPKRGRKPAEAPKTRGRPSSKPAGKKPVGKASGKKPRRTDM